MKELLTLGILITAIAALATFNLGCQMEDDNKIKRVDLTPTPQVVEDTNKTAFEQERACGLRAQDCADADENRVYYYYIDNPTDFTPYCEQYAIENGITEYMNLYTSFNSHGVTCIFTLPPKGHDKLEPVIEFPEPPN